MPQNLLYQSSAEILMGCRRYCLPRCLHIGAQRSNRAVIGRAGANDRDGSCFENPAPGFSFRGSRAAPRHATVSTRVFGSVHRCVCLSQNCFNVIGGFGHRGDAKTGCDIDGIILHRNSTLLQSSRSLSAEIHVYERRKRDAATVPRLKLKSHLMGGNAAPSFYRQFLAPDPVLVGRTTSTGKGLTRSRWPWMGASTFYVRSLLSFSPEIAA
ncbi:hypothetical protein DFI02_105292 [Rhizobium sp. PP-F2F-G20b]|nr:hypothetical protein DFI02_105292 [Rhizobium sp. PP-F2F-G20b]